MLTPSPSFHFRPCSGGSPRRGVAAVVDPERPRTSVAPAGSPCGRRGDERVEASGPCARSCPGGSPLPAALPERTGSRVRSSAGGQEQQGQRGQKADFIAVLSSIAVYYTRTFPMPTNEIFRLWTFPTQMKNSSDVGFCPTARVSLWESISSGKATKMSGHRTCPFGPRDGTRLLISRGQTRGIQMSTSANCSRDCARTGALAAGIVAKKLGTQKG